ncbi:MAG: hypothetical protein ACOYXM_15310 [Actinomycetota bacterium]
MLASRRARRVLASGVLVVLAAGLAMAPVARADGDHGGHAGPEPPGVGGRVGVLLADHGEPPEYNQWTYESFREFFQHLIAMGIIPAWLTALETGTILYDADCPACTEPSDSPRLIDAWLRPHDGPAAFVPASDSLPAHYVLPGGPGFREPDIFEHVGLSAWHEWQRMGGRSPNYDEKLIKKQAVIERLRAAYGDDLAVRVGYGIDPRLGGGRQGIREALDALVNRERIDTLVVVYHGVGFSDIMQTHHLRHQIAEHLETLGVADTAVRYAQPLGTTDHYVAAIVDKVKAELAVLPPEAPVAIHLSGHGLSRTMCGDYDCGADAYHRYAAELFEQVKTALEAAVDRPGLTGVFHIYGDSGEGDADPDNEVTSPIEGLDARAAEGWTHVVDIPYEFDSNSRDTLIVLRQGYNRPQPDWNQAYESHFSYKNLQVKIANANGGEAHKTDALEAVTHAALGGLIRPSAVAAATQPGPHNDNNDLAHQSANAHTSRPASTATGPAGPSDQTAGHHSPLSKSLRFDTVGAAAPTSQHDEVGGTDHHAGATSADLAADRAGHTHGRGGAGAAVGLLLALGGGAALAMGAAARRRMLAGRLAAAGLGAQLAGLGWDVVTHAQTGEGVHLLENGGHWTATVGLAVTATAAALLLRTPATTNPPAATM